MKSCSALFCVYGLVLSSISVNLINAYACEPLSYRTGVTVHCENPITKESVDCRTEKVPVGTVVQYHCDEYYLTQDGDRSGGSMKCDEKGNWTPQQHFRAFSCNIDCGRLSDSASTTYWPWHAAIFIRENPAAPFKYRCGGTLINPFNSGFVVISAASCLRNQDGFAAELNNVKVFMGLVSTDFNKNAGSEEVKTFSVKEIAVENQGSLALLKFEQDVQLSRNVLPACFNGNADVAVHQLQEGASGKIVGFGKIQNQERPSGEALRSFSARITRKGDCRSKVGVNEFCAGNRATRNICSGDLGGGLLFPILSGSSQRSYLQGVLTEPLEDNSDCKHFAAFTRVNDFAAWIKDTSLLFSSGANNQQQEIKHNPNQKQPQDNTGKVDIAFQTNRPFPPQGPIPIVPATPTENQKYYRPISQLNTGNRRQKPPQSPNQRPSNRPVNLPPKIPEVDTSETGTHVFNLKDYELVGVERHNYYRAKHGSPPLTLSAELSQEAQSEAVRSIQENKYRFEGFTNYFGLNGGNLNSTRLVHEAITDWYKTSANYDYNQPRALPFTNVVWRDTKEIGVGIAKKGTKQIVIVKYNRPLIIDGEQEKEYRENVRRPVPYNK